VIAPVACVPLTGSVPDHAPEAVHEVASVEDQLSVVLPPLATLAAPALSETFGAGAPDTVTVADCAAAPPAPVQTTTNLVVAVSAGVLAQPLVGCVPLQPPEAVHEVALADDHLNIDAVPFFTALGLADRVTTAAGLVTDTVADWVALPPAPEHVSA
jgi:hypothetical protein